MGTRFAGLKGNKNKSIYLALLAKEQLGIDTSAVKKNIILFNFLFLKIMYFHSIQKNNKTLLGGIYNIQMYLDVHQQQMYVTV